MAPRTRGSDYKTLTMDFMKTMGLRPCFKAWTTNGSMVRKNPKGELLALRFDFFRFLTSHIGGDASPRPPIGYLRASSPVHTTRGR